MIAVALVVGACGRADTLGPEEAVEVMVLDGIDRGRAICIVETVGADIDLAKVSGLEVGLTDDELRLLAGTSAQCAPALALNGPVVLGQQPLDEAAVAASLAETNEALDAGVARLVDDGLEYVVGQCLAGRIDAMDDPHAAFADLTVRAEMIVECRLELGLDAGG